MNLTGSYRNLCNNSKTAMLAAIEIYNKPQISYRDECFTILLVNAWELLLKAILSKNKQRIYYPKERNKKYRTFTVHDSLEKAKIFFPLNIQFEPLAQNLEMLITYRNNSIHFYNQKGFSVVIYGLAQTSITNFRDLMYRAFDVDITSEMSISLLPLSLGTQPDPIVFMKKAKDNLSMNKAVAQFLKEISQITNNLEENNIDTSRFLTIFNISLQSIKKISSADVVVGVKGQVNDEGPLFIERRVDPNKSHPLTQTKVLSEIGEKIHGIKFTSFTLQAIVWKHDFVNKPQFYWRPSAGGVIQYSREVPSFIKKISKNDLESVINEFKKYRRNKRKSKVNKT